MDLSVSPKDELWFLRVCHHISKAVRRNLVSAHVSSHFKSSKTKSGFCACVITFQTQSTIVLELKHSRFQRWANLGSWFLNVEVHFQVVLIEMRKEVRELKRQGRRCSFNDICNIIYAYYVTFRCNLRENLDRRHIAPKFVHCMLSETEKRNQLPVLKDEQDQAKRTKHRNFLANNIQGDQKVSVHLTFTVPTQLMI
jgi:hypothetical protein